MGGGNEPERPPGDQLPPRSPWDSNAGKYDRPSSRVIQGDPLVEAALDYAARGWPVFPCNPKNKQPLLAAKKGDDGKPIKGTGGVSAAVTDPAQIRAWWRKWPKAMIGLATGHERMFAVDFDPRHDDVTGEEWTLERLKGEVETQIGVDLPATLAVRTPSDGVHLYFRQDGGVPIGNRGNLPEHVDVRGLGGYVIAPPSVMGDGGQYRWLRGQASAAIADAPSELLAVLRDRGGKAQVRPSTGSGRTQARVASPMTSDDAVRKYALAALDGECQAVRSSPSGQRNPQLNTSALKIASLVAAGALDGSLARSCIEAAARDNPGRDADSQLIATIDSGWTAGLGQPRDLAEVAAASSRRSSSSRGGRAPPPPGDGRSDPSGPLPAVLTGQPSIPFQYGRSAPDRPQRGPGEPVAAPRVPSDAERGRLLAIAGAWLSGRLAKAEHSPDAYRAIAWGIGRRVAGDLLDEGEAMDALWAEYDGLSGLSHADVDQAVEDGRRRGYNPGADLLDLDCSRHPMTDFGIAERFRDRHGSEFRFTTAQGWLGWDGRRWKTLDQDEKSPPAEVIAAVFETVRDIQREARRVEQTGVKFELVRIGKQQELALDEANPHGLDRWVAVGKGWKLHSTLMAAWGRQSETTGKPAAVALLARRWLTVPIEQFDCEQMAINAMNCTLRFDTEVQPDGSKMVRVRLDPHRREDLITRLAAVEYDPAAACPIYDAMLAWAQPHVAMRRYVHQVGGYASSGDTGEHKLWFNYGHGRNGKSTTIDSWCSALGDYSGTVGIETFLDQGIKKRGDAATPDLAKLGGVRMLRASEPERGAKLNSALIKYATGGEPMSVRALHRGFYDLHPRFKLLISGNSKPVISDTDEGIWGRLKLMFWGRHIEKPEEDPYAGEFPDAAASWPIKDTQLVKKIKGGAAGGIGPGELNGVFRRLIEGLVDYLEHGFVEPEQVTLATQAYRDKSDPLERFLRLCTERDLKSRVKSSELHGVFVAWCKAAGEKEWTIKGFGDALDDKGFTKVRSDGMRWEGLRLIRSASDFVDHEGKVLAVLPDLDADGGLPRSGSDPPDARLLVDDDDDLPF